MIGAVVLQNIETKQCITLEKHIESLERRDLDSSQTLICRTCLSVNDLRALFDNEQNTSQHEEMTHKLRLATGLEIRRNDGLSQKICEKCLSAIDFVLNFRLKSKNAEDSLICLAKEHLVKSEAKNNDVNIPGTMNISNKLSNRETEARIPCTDNKLFIKSNPVKLEKQKISFANGNDVFDDIHDPVAYCDSDSEEDLKPLKCFKKDPSSNIFIPETEPIITIKKISSTSNENIAVTSLLQKRVKLKIKKTRRDINLREKQDRSNKISTFIKVDNLPTDWYEYIAPAKTKKKKRKEKNDSLDTENKKREITKDMNTDENPVLIKVENLPDSLPMAKRARSNRKIDVPEGPPYKCGTCGKQYMKRPLFLSHVRFHTHFHVCEVCGKKCRNPSLLRVHQRALHGLAKVHRCARCDYSAATKCALVVHERRHSDERPFVCDHCGAAFFTRRTLAQHVGLHMPANIQCPHCPKKLKSMKLLSNHRARKHAKRYSYRCPVCPKVFNDNNAVHKHLSGYHGMPRPQHPKIEKQLVL